MSSNNASKPSALSHLLLLLFVAGSVFASWYLYHQPQSVTGPQKRPLKPSVLKVSTQQSTGLKTLEIKIRGMHCDGCIQIISSTLKQTPGVTDAKVTLKPQRATVTYDPQRVNAKKLLAAVRKAGYKARTDTTKSPTIRKSSLPKSPSGARRINLQIAGMTCTGCVTRLKEALTEVKGIFHFEVTLHPPQTIITYDPKRTSEKKLRTIVRKAGYRVIRKPKKVITERAPKAK